MGSPLNGHGWGASNVQTVRRLRAEGEMQTWVRVGEGEETGDKQEGEGAGEGGGKGSKSGEGRGWEAAGAPAAAVREPSLSCMSA